MSVAIRGNVAVRGNVFMGDSFSILGLSPALWLDASDASTLYDATTGGSLVAADGAVARWEDKSGNVRHVTQGTLANRPLRKTSIQNSKDIIRFDGTDILATSSFSTSGFSSGSTIFAVAFANFANNAAYRPLLRIEPSNTNGIQHQASNDPAVNSRSKLEVFTQNTLNAWFRATPTSTTSAVWQLLASVVTTSDITLFINGSTDDGPTSITGTIKTGTDTLRVGGEAAISRWIGDIAEILIFSTALSTADRQAVEAYLNAKWAIY